MEHNRWLSWKIKHGLAQRGRTGSKNALQPQGVLAKLLYYGYFKYTQANAPAKEPLAEGPRVFHQNVGGTVGVKGKINGGQ